MAEEQKETEKAGAMHASNVIITNKMKGINPVRRRGERQWKYTWGKQVGLANTIFFLHFDFWSTCTVGLGNIKLLELK